MCYKERLRVDPYYQTSKAAFDNKVVPALCRASSSCMKSTVSLSSICYLSKHR